METGGRVLGFAMFILREFDPVHLRKWAGLLQLLAELDLCPSWLVKVTQEEIRDWVRVMVNSFLEGGWFCQLSGGSGVLSPQGAFA